MSINIRLKNNTPYDFEDTTNSNWEKTIGVDSYKSKYTNGQGSVFGYKGGFINNNNQTVNLTADFSIFMWAQFYNIYKADSVDFLNNFKNWFIIRFENGTSIVEEIPNTIDLSDNQYHSICIYRTGSNVYIYIDSVLFHQSTSTAALNLSSNSFILIGNIDEDISSYMIPVIDDLIITDSASYTGSNIPASYKNTATIEYIDYPPTDTIAEEDKTDPYTVNVEEADIRMYDLNKVIDVFHRNEDWSSKDSFIYDISTISKATSSTKSHGASLSHNNTFLYDWTNPNYNDMNLRFTDKFMVSMLIYIKENIQKAFYYKETLYLIIGFENGKYHYVDLSNIENIVMNTVWITIYRVNTIVYVMINGKKIAYFIESGVFDLTNISFIYLGSSIGNAIEQYLLTVIYELYITNQLTSNMAYNVSSFKLTNSVTTEQTNNIALEFQYEESTLSDVPDPYELTDTGTGINVIADYLLINDMVPTPLDIYNQEEWYWSSYDFYELYTYIKNVSNDSGNSDVSRIIRNYNGTQLNLFYYQTQLANMRLALLCNKGNLIFQPDTEKTYDLNLTGDFYIHLVIAYDSNKRTNEYCELATKDKILYIQFEDGYTVSVNIPYKKIASEIDLTQPMANYYSNLSNSDQNRILEALDMFGIIQVISIYRYNGVLYVTRADNEPVYHEINDHVLNFNDNASSCIWFGSIDELKDTKTINNTVYNDTHIIQLLIYNGRKELLSQKPSYTNTSSYAMSSYRTLDDYSEYENKYSLDYYLNKYEPSVQFEVINELYLKIY